MKNVDEILIEHRKEIATVLNDGTKPEIAWENLRKQFPNLGTWKEFQPKLSLFLAFYENYSKHISQQKMRRRT